MKAEHGLGTVRTVRDRKTGTILGYRALLPREQSRAKRGSKPSKLYQEPVGPLCATPDEARRLLVAVMHELRDHGAAAVAHGLPLSSLVAAEIQARTNEARRRYGTTGKASRAVATWRSIDRNWLSAAPFYSYPPSAIELSDYQRWVDYLVDEAEGQSGEPLSASFIRNCGALLKATLERAPGGNLAKALRLPGKTAPTVRYLELAAQRRLFGTTGERIPLVDRVMVGCGMGPGLRVGELLAFEIDDVHLDAADPHLVVRFGGSHHAPTKSGLVRRVELFEPALGFWRLFLDRFYRGGRRVFAGPVGGYRKAWPELFPSWAEAAGVDRLSSHVMRHTYAVAMLSGSWGYEPRTLEFVSKQLGHADVQTTERYYGAFEFGVWQREVRRMTGRDPVLPIRPVTALELLGLDASNDASGGTEPGFSWPIAVGGGTPPSLTQNQQNLGAPAELDASAHHSPAVWSLALAAEAALRGRIPVGPAVALTEARRRRPRKGSAAG